MLKSVLSILVGVFAALVVTMVVQGAGHAIYPPPPGIDLGDPAQIARVMDQIPLGAKVSVLLAWGLGSLLGGAVAARMAPRRPLTHALAVGAIQMAGGAVTLYQIPHPLWMTVVGLALFLPAAVLGARLAELSEASRR